MALTSNLKSCLEGLGSTWLNQTRYPDVEEGPNFHLVWVPCGTEWDPDFPGLKRKKISKNAKKTWNFQVLTTKQSLNFVFLAKI